MPVDDGTVSVVSEPPNSRTQPTLRGLGAFSTRYPVDFDVHPLELGTYFHQSTLIGSGDFDDSLSLRGRDLDVPAGHISIQCNNKNMQWSCWTDEVASDLSTVFSFISIQLQACTRLQQPHELDHQATSAAPQITYLLRSVVRYLSGCLSFLDPVDRRSCVVRVFHILGDLLHNTLASTGNAPAAQQVSTSTGQLLTRTMLFILVLARQVLQVANHPSVKASVKSDIEGLILSTARQLIGTIVRPSTSQIRDFLEKNRRHLFREAGIGDEDLSVEVVVITAHTLTKASIAGHGIWTMINEVLTKRMERVHRVQVLDRIWQDLFIVLPLLEIDASGLLRVGRRFENSMEDWTMIKTLLSCLFAAYSETSRAQSCTMNAYIRAVLNRCHCLVQSWGWRRCEIMLSTVFDFFARNGLAQLHLEGSRGSPRFLEHLDQDLHLTVDPEDRAFHIFLKILATGLKGMRGSYTDQKIRGIAWRFIPNHGRMYRKDEAVRQEELDALRNHHDLLCTLYWSSPVGFRPRTDLLRNLVDHSTSHREACRLNVRSWANLVKYQLSTDEAVSALGPFALWHREIVDVTIAQYKLARTEAESQFEAARIRGTLNISNELLQSTISTNQRQVLATLSDAILAMREAIRIAKSEAASSALLLSSSVMEVFSLLDAKNVSVNAAIAEALSIVPEYLNLVEKLQGQAESQRHSEESQDYGDWSGFEEVAADPGYGHTTDGFFNFIHEPLSQLLSNCFGSEVTPEDALLAKVVDSWTLIARRMVHSGKKGWNHYLDSYSPNSWHQLRDTEQTRKFAAYFMLSVIDADHHSYEIHGPDFISSWLISLVERESMLKFQHRLTSVLLNVDPANPLLRNLPFTADPVTDSYGIDLHTLRERRLGLIASVLSNMRESFDDALHDNPSSVLELRREYTSYLKQMMAAMKKNYQELQGSRALTADTTNGAYVSFVQRIVEFLQQHTSDICPVDRFFTDSAAFPLPATDPTYVVGRLKAYGLKLYDARTRKQLAVFIQSVSERASVDGQQPYLVGQLSTAMCGLYERGDRARPSLRYFLITAVFPAYVELSYKPPCGWILAKPILQASREVLDDLVYDYSITDPASVEAVVAIVTTTLGVLRQAVELLIDHSELLEQPHSLSVLAVMFQVVTATLLNVHYIHRRTNSARSASLVENSIKHIDFFRSFSLFVASTLLGHQDAPATILEDHISDTTDNAFADVREFCSRELVAAMGKAWVKHDGQYFVLRGKDRKEVVVRTRTLDGEKKRVVEAIEEFHGVFDRISGLGVNEEEEEVSRGVGWLAGVFV
ncbi:hypothetical protein LTR04_004825 [Oleoguttula sp. CCFEE 6159]|nr:hypothetical protein LTR04_004825 [Oleoguttula sp. CCFEE 6159]